MERLLNCFRCRSKTRIVMPLKQLLNTCLSCRTARNRAFIYTVSQRPTARLTTQRPVWATCTRLISSWNYHKRRCFTFSITWREREHNTWLLLRSKSKVGDSIQSIWCGFKDTKNQKQSMMNMNRLDLSRINRFWLIYFRGHIFISITRDGLNVEKKVLRLNIVTWKIVNYL